MRSHRNLAMRLGETPEGELEDSGRGHNTASRRLAALLAAVPLGSIGAAALGAGAAGATSGNAASGGLPSARTGSAPKLPPAPGPGASASQWQSWAAAQRSAFEAIPWRSGLEAFGCQVDSIAFTSAPADIGTPGAPAGVDVTGIDVAAKCPAGVTPLSLLAAPAPAKANGPSLRSHSVPIGNVCGSVTDGTQCVYAYQNGGTYVEVGYTNQTSNTIDGYEEESVEGATAQSCYVGSEVAQSPASGYTSLGPQVTLYAMYGPINADNVWDGTFWKGTGSYSDTGDVCSYI
jgi:hypothetical protein